MKNGPYILILAPSKYPCKKYRGRYAYEHKVVWWENTGTAPSPKTHQIHHRNGDPSDNRFENLEVLTIKEHLTRHATKQWTNVFETCLVCKKIFKLGAADYRRRIKASPRGIFCSRICQVKGQNKVGIIK